MPGIQMSTLLLALSTLGCGPADCADGYGRDGDGNCVPLDLGGGEEPGSTGSGGTGGDTGDTGGELTFGACEAPASLGADPLAEIGGETHTQTEPGEWFMEIVDLEVDLEAQIAWAVGVGGLMSFDVSDPTAPALLTDFSDRYHKIEIHEGVAYAIHRDRGLTAFDATNPENLINNDYFYFVGLEGLAAAGDRLYVVQRLDGEVWVFDISEPREPALLTKAGGLGSPWDITLAGDVAYVSDNELGVVPVDLSDPDAPIVGAHVEVGGGVQEIAVGDGAIYAAAGGAGVIALDASDPLTPTLTEAIPYGASVQSVALDGDVLWAVNQEDLIALDVSDPLHPAPVAAEQTEFFSMHVAAEGGLAYVGDWNRLSVWALDAATPGPEADLSSDEIFLRAEAETLALTLTNRGGADLEIVGLEVDDARLSASIDRRTVGPGEAAAVTLEWAGADEDVEAGLCIATNDGDAPLIEAVLHTGSGGNNEAVGEPAPDFTLQGIDGTSYTLSEQLGDPVVLIYFATW